MEYVVLSIIIVVAIFVGVVLLKKHKKILRPRWDEI